MKTENQTSPVVAGSRKLKNAVRVVTATSLFDGQGETFQQWIRWDSLISVLRHKARVAPQSLKIQEIRPEDPSGQRVVLKLAVGSGAIVKLVTEDQGNSWYPLTR